VVEEGEARLRVGTQLQRALEGKGVLERVEHVGVHLVEREVLDQLPLSSSCLGEQKRH